jgi:pimeloyl-ACP methyl ester carboxylesterase
MTTLAVILALLCAGMLVTLFGVTLIERAHPPRGRFVDIGNLRQHVVELGVSSETGNSAPPIVLLHGAGCNLEDMRLALGERLAARHRVILIDRPGHGWSERSGTHGSLPTYQAAILRSLLDQLAVDRAIIVGHSWGAALAATFALDYPQRVAGVVLIAPPSHPRLRRTVVWTYAAFAMPLAGWLFARTLALPFGALFLSSGMGAAFLPQRPPRGYLQRTAALLLLRPAAFLANARDVAGLKTFLARQVARYGSLSAPTVIITGDRDIIVSPQHHSVALTAAVPGAKLVVLPGLGHMLHHAAADRIIAIIEERIASSEREPAAN